MKSKTFLCLFVLASAAHAQPVIAGIKLGAPLTDAIHLSSSATLAAVTADTHHYVVGPFVEVKLPWKFSVEVDALYRSYEYQLAPGASNNSVGSWEFPVMAKRKLFSGPIKPYVEGGLVFSHLTGVKNAAELLHQANYGITIGAGVEIHALLVRISPEIRYDGFAFRNFNSPGDLIQSNRNQAMFLVGISF
jgi:hypothetical protein